MPARSINNCFFPVRAQSCRTAVCVIRGPASCWCCSLPCVSGRPAGGLHAATAKCVLIDWRGGCQCVLCRAVAAPCSCPPAAHCLVCIDWSLSILAAAPRAWQPVQLPVSLWPPSLAPLSFGSLQSRPRFLCSLLLQQLFHKQAAPERKRAPVWSLQQQQQQEQWWWWFAVQAGVLAWPLWVCRSFLAWTC